jgi:hypothetical protein
MKEGNPGQPETQQPKTNVIDFAAARQKRQAEETSRTTRPDTPPLNRQERQRVKPQQLINAEPAPHTDYTTEGKAKQPAWTREDDALVNEILYGTGKPGGERGEKDPAREELDKLAVEKGWEAVADKLWTRMAEFESEYMRKYDTPEPKKRKLPNIEDTREQINERLSRIHRKPLSDQQWEEWERMREVDPETLSVRQWREWKGNPASMTDETVRDTEEYLQEIKPAKEWLDRLDETWRKARWEKIAVPEFAKRLGLDANILTPQERQKLASFDPETFNRTQWLGLNPFALTPGEQKELGAYDSSTISYAQELGLNPLTLTPAEREDLFWGETILKHANKLGLDPRALTPEERFDLRRHGRIRTPQERKEREEWEKKHSVKPPTPEEWSQLLRTWVADIRRGEREKAAWIAKRDPRYDPMTGDLLETDEFPLHPDAEYYFDGKTRGRRFIPPDSPHLKAYKPLQIDESLEQVLEGESHERLVKRLQKAGFVEVEPTLSDKAYFEKTQWYRSLSPAEKMQYLQATMREMREGTPKEFDPENDWFLQLCKMIKDMIKALISGF